MASRIPIRRPRTLGAENENARPTAAPARAKILGRAVPSAASSKPGPGTKTVVVAGASDVAVASVPKGKSKRLIELEALGSAKRKHQALQELGTRKNLSGTGALSAEKRRILGLPKKHTATAAVVQGAARPQVFVPPPVATAHPESVHTTVEPSLPTVSKKRPTLSIRAQDHVFFFGFFFFTPGAPAADGVALEQATAVSAAAVGASVAAGHSTLWRFCVFFMSDRLSASNRLRKMDE